MPLHNNFKKRVSSSLAIIATFGVATLGSGAAHAQTLYVIGQDLWRINLSGTGTTGTATATKLNSSAFTWTGYTYTNRTGTSVTSTGNGNGLAFNSVNNSLIYADGGTRNLYSYSLTSNTITSLGSLPLAGYDLTQYNLQGSASFYNGKYYVMPELINYQQAGSTTINKQEALRSTRRGTF